MHRKNPISVLVYNTLFPTPSPTDPPSFSAHLSKNLVGEVRIETANFYGSLDTIEARYPGLNYAFAPHRKRLGRFPHHRKLFAAFDALGLTESEIQGFCRWEGTLWARERYERDEGVKVIDTTGTEIGEWVDGRHIPQLTTPSRDINVKTDIEVEITPTVPSPSPSPLPSPTPLLSLPLWRSLSGPQFPTPGSQQARERNQRVMAQQRLHQQRLREYHQQQQQQQQQQPPPPQQPQQPQHQDTEMPDSPSSSDSEEDTDPTIAFSLRARLLHDDQGSAEMDPEWEQFLKEAQERGEIVLG